MFDWIENLFDFFSDMGGWISFLTSFLALLPPVFLTCVSIILIGAIIFGGFYILLKLIG